MLSISFGTHQKSNLPLHPKQILVKLSHLYCPYIGKTQLQCCSTEGIQHDITRYARPGSTLWSQVQPDRPGPPLKQDTGQCSGVDKPVVVLQADYSVEVQVLVQAEVPMGSWQADGRGMESMEKPEKSSKRNDSRSKRWYCSSHNLCICHLFGVIKIWFNVLLLLLVLLLLVLLLRFTSAKGYWNVRLNMIYEDSMNSPWMRSQC